MALGLRPARSCYIYAAQDTGQIAFETMESIILTAVRIAKYCAHIQMMIVARSTKTMSHKRLVVLQQCLLPRRSYDVDELKFQVRLL